MRYLKVGFLLFILSLLISCKEPTDEEVFYEIQKSFNQMDSYSCISNITVYGNKSSKTYKEKHIFKRPNKYIIEVIEPEESKGCLTVYNGQQAWLYHPGIDQSIVIKDFKESPEENMFLGYFLKNIVTTEDVKIKSETIDNDEFLVVTIQLPGNNKYRYMEELWINKRNFIPYKLVVYDNKGNIQVEAIYSQFKEDYQIDEEDFTIEESKELTDN